MTSPFDSATSTPTNAQALTHLRELAKANGTVTVGTHNGPFQCDEVFACVLLEMLLGEIKITRTRDEKVLSTLDVLVDVGQTFNVEQHRFDHHQRGFAASFDETTKMVKLSSAGLVYQTHGLQVLTQLLTENEVTAAPWTEGDLSLLHAQYYTYFVAAIDGFDNGIAPCQGKENYRESTTLTARVSRLHKDDMTAERADEAFKGAMDYVRNEFRLNFSEFVGQWLETRRVVTAAFDAMEDNVHPVPKGVLLLEKWCAYAPYIKELEKQRKLEPIYFVVLLQEGTWKIQYVVADNQFEARLCMPEAWRQLCNSIPQLCEVTGVDDIVFLHKDGIFAGCKSKAGALKMAGLAVQEALKAIPK